MNPTRRQLLASGVAAAGLALPGCGWLGRERSALVLAGARAANGQHLLAALEPQGEVAWLRPREQRAHDIAISNDGQVAAVFDRRPGRSAELLNVRDGSLRQRIVCDETTQLNGHGVFDASRNWLWATETRFDDNGQPSGWLSAYDLNTRVSAARQPSGGLDPHQCLRVGPFIVVVNGGYRESPGGVTAKFLASDQPPNVSWMNIRTGEHQASNTLPDPALSLRHLAVASEGQVVVAAQSDRGVDDDTALVFVASMAGGMRPLPAPEGGWRQLAGYVGSVAAHGNTVMATSPRGACAVRWNLAADAPGTVTRIADVSGAGFAGNTAVLTAGTGALISGDHGTRQAMAFDNHLRVVEF